VDKDDDSVGGSTPSTGSCSGFNCGCQTFLGVDHLIFKNGRIKQSYLTAEGKQFYYRYAEKNAKGEYSGQIWTAWAKQNAVEMPNYGYSTVSSVDYVVFPNGRIKYTILGKDGKTSYSRYAEVNASGDYAGQTWTAWAATSLPPITVTSGTYSTFLSYDHVVFPNGRIKQTFLTADGKRILYRYAEKNANGDYAGQTWTSWAEQLMTVTIGNTTYSNFKGFDQAVFPNGRIKQSFISADGAKILYRYAEVNANGDYAGQPWTAWAATGLSCLVDLSYRPPTPTPTSVSVSTPVPTARTATPFVPTLPLVPTAEPTLTSAINNCPKSSQGDATCDGNINEDDFSLWNCEFIESATNKCADAAIVALISSSPTDFRTNYGGKMASFSRNSFVSLIDFEIWRRNYYSAPSATPAANETPTSTPAPTPTSGAVSNPPTPTLAPTAGPTAVPTATSTAGTCESCGYVSGSSVGDACSRNCPGDSSCRGVSASCPGASTECWALSCVR